MKISAEVAIDLDEKRRVWVELSAEGENVEEVAGALASAASEAAVASYTRARTNHPERGRESTARPAPPKEKKPDLRGMGELDEDPEVTRVMKVVDGKHSS
jgi:hypothetical protein